MEREGLATANISLVRLHSEREPSPRALWVPYLLGRPFGAPNDPVFQRSVMDRLFGLLDDATERTLIDHERDAPATPGRDDWRPGLDLDFLPHEPLATAALLDAFDAEIAVVAAHHEGVLRARGSTMTGQAGLTSNALVEFVADAFADRHVQGRSGRQGGVTLLHASRDIMHMYFEAALHGAPDAPWAARTWFWTETVAGHVLRRLCRRLPTSGDDRTRWMGENKVLCPSDFLDAYESDDAAADAA